MRLGPFLNHTAGKLKNSVYDYELWQGLGGNKGLY